jgi:hypothetical protein
MHPLFLEKNEKCTLEFQKNLKKILRVGNDPVSRKPVGIHLLGDGYGELSSVVSKTGMGIKRSPHPIPRCSPLYLYIHINWHIFI